MKHIFVGSESIAFHFSEKLFEPFPNFGNVFSLTKSWKENSFVRLVGVG